MSNSKKAESGFKNWINNLQEKRRVVVSKSITADKQMERTVDAKPNSRKRFYS